MIIIGAGALVLIVIVISLLVSALQPDTNIPKQLAARLQSTETIVGNAQPNLKSSKLRALNSSLKIYLTNTNRDIAAPLLLNKIDVTKLDKKIIASEAGTEMVSRLEDARLNAVYDRTYAREIAYQLDTIVTLMSQVGKNTSSKSLKEVLTTAQSNLEPIQKQFEDYNAANG